MHTHTVLDGILACVGLESDSRAHRRSAATSGPIHSPPMRRHDSLPLSATTALPPCNKKVLRPHRESGGPRTAAAWTSYLRVMMGCLAISEPPSRLSQV